MAKCFEQGIHHPPNTGTPPNNLLGALEPAKGPLLQHIPDKGSFRLQGARNWTKLHRLTSIIHQVVLTMALCLLLLLSCVTYMPVPRRASYLLRLQECQIYWGPLGATGMSCALPFESSFFEGPLWRKGTQGMFHGGGKSLVGLRSMKVEWGRGVISIGDNV